jgi:hypothetical protein
MNEHKKRYQHVILNINRRILFVFVFFLMGFKINVGFSQDWKPVEGQLMTTWGSSVTPDNVLQEYPRPQMVRKNWVNLNGLWDFCISNNGSKDSMSLSRKILVPFCVESALSGIKETVRPFQQMTYRKYISIPDTWIGKKILLHFDAVDDYTKLWIDGSFVGDHKGGYDAFQFDIAPFLQSGKNHEIKLIVTDSTDTGIQPAGKQVLPERLNKVKYTATSGIWQTVWMEPVANSYIKNIKITPQFNLSTCSVEVTLENHIKGMQIKILAFDNGKEVASVIADPTNKIQLEIKNAKLWSPDSPFLYDLKLTLIKDGQKLDEVTSYFGMRNISMARDQSGFMRIFLNNKQIYQLGPLDQGYWPDGILTPPSDQAISTEIAYLKSVGANMERIHMKVQPERWYYHCDKQGILVWQDMVSLSKNVLRSQYGNGTNWEAYCEKIINQLNNHPSIIQWVIFNESWAQYDTERITEWFKKKDTSRLVINASGWNDYPVGDIRDIHDYTFIPAIPYVTNSYPRAIVLGEAGGFDMPIANHTWNPSLKMTETVDWLTDMRRVVINNTNMFAEKYNEWVISVSLLRNHGLNAVVYTQLSDVENEVNGWITYDRKVSKVSAKQIADIHKQFYAPLPQGETLVALSANPQTVGLIKKGESISFTKEFTLKKIPEKLSLILVNKGISEIYINSEKIMGITNFIKKDAEVKVSEIMLTQEALKMLKAGLNTVMLKFIPGSIYNAEDIVDIGLKQYEN